MNQDKYALKYKILVWTILVVALTMLFCTSIYTDVQIVKAKKRVGVVTGSGIETPLIPPSPAPQVTETSAPLETLLPVLLPEEIQNIYTCGMGKNKVKISWTESLYATQYMLYRKKQGETKYAFLETTSLLRYIDRNISYGKKYYYKVIPVNYQEEQMQLGTEKKIVYINKQIVSTNHKKYSYGEMSRDIPQLNDKYHGIVTYEIIGKSADGRNIYDIIVGNPEAKKTMLVVSTLHAREYMASLLCMNQIEFYLSHYWKSIQGKKVNHVLDKISIHYVVMANPDGVAISQFGFDAIRDKRLREKLRKMWGSSKRWKANARGVDLNRNFPFQFNVHGKAGREGYSGAYAGSESETKSIVRLVEYLRKNKKLKGVINYHAMGSIIFGSCKSGSIVKKATTRMYRLARQITGYISAAGYHSSVPGSGGSFREYVMYKKKVASITIEIGKISCPGPIWEYPSIWEKNSTLVFREAVLFV